MMCIKSERCRATHHLFSWHTGCGEDGTVLEVTGIEILGIEQCGVGVGGMHAMGWSACGNTLIVPCRRCLRVLVSVACCGAHSTEVS